METPYLDSDINLLKNIRKEKPWLNPDRHREAHIRELESIKKIVEEYSNKKNISEKQKLIGYLNIIESCYDIEFGDLEKAANYILSKD